MKKHFIKMLSIPIPGMTEEDEETKDDIADVTADRWGNSLLTFWKSAVITLCFTDTIR